MTPASIFFIVVLLCAPAFGAGFKAAPVRFAGIKAVPAAGAFVSGKAPVLANSLKLSVPSLTLSLPSLNHSLTPLSPAAVPSAAALSRPSVISPVLNAERAASGFKKPVVSALASSVEGIVRSKQTGNQTGVRKNLNALFGERVHRGASLTAGSFGAADGTAHPGFGRDGRRRPQRRDLPGRYLAVLDAGNSLLQVELFIDQDGGYEIQIGGPAGPGGRLSGKWEFVDGRFVGRHTPADGEEVSIRINFDEASREGLASKEGAVVGLTSPIFGGEDIRLDIKLSRIEGPHFPPTTFADPDDVPEAVSKVKALFSGLPKSGKGHWSNEAGEKADMSSVILELSEEAEDRVTIKFGFNWPEGDRVERTITLIAGELPELRVRSGFTRGPAETAGLIREARLEIGAQHVAIHTPDAVYTLRYTSGVLDWTVKRPDGLVEISLKKPSPRPVAFEPDYWGDGPWHGSHHIWRRRMPPMF